MIFNFWLIFTIALRVYKKNAKTRYLWLVTPNKFFSKHIIDGDFSHWIYNGAFKTNTNFQLHANYCKSKCLFWLYIVTLSLSNSWVYTDVSYVYVNLSPLLCLFVVYSTNLAIQLLSHYKTMGTAILEDSLYRSNPFRTSREDRCTLVRFLIFST